MPALRLLLRALFPFVIAAAAAVAADGRAGGPKIVRIWPGYRTADQGERLVEFFGKPEPTDTRTILRSQPEKRAGFYFLVRLEAPGLPEGARLWRVRYLIPGSPRMRVREFPVNAFAGRTVFELGLTGDDWLDPKAQPTAWHLALIGAQGEVLAVEQSFLWSDRATR